MVEYFVERNGKRFGPTTFQELVGLGDKGQLHGSDLIVERGREPRLASSIQELNAISRPRRQGNLLVIPDATGMPLRCVMTGEQVAFTEVEERELVYHRWGPWAVKVKLLVEALGVIVGKDYHPEHITVDLITGISKTYRRTRWLTRIKMWGFLLVLPSIYVASSSLDRTLAVTLACIIGPLWLWLVVEYLAKRWRRTGRKWRAAIPFLTLPIMATFLIPTSSFRHAMRSDFSFFLEGLRGGCVLLNNSCLGFFYLLLLKESVSPFPRLQIMKFNEGRSVVKGVGQPFLETLEEISDSEQRAWFD